MSSANSSPSIQQVADHYDSLGEFYRDVWGDELHHGYWIESGDSTQTAIQNLRNAVIDLANLSTGAQVFDVGSGYGALAIRLAREWKAQVTGWTVSMQQHKVATKSASQAGNETPAPTFRCENWLQADLPGERADIVVSIECLSHLHEKSEFFQKAFQSLRPGGRLVIADWYGSPGMPSLKREWLIDPICRGGQLAPLISTERLIQFAEGARFELHEFREISSQVRKTWWVIATRLIAKIATESQYIRLLFGNFRRNGNHALTIGRLLLAYYTGAIHYALICFEKPDR